MTFEELYKEGYRIIRWYECKGSEKLDHLVCYRKSDRLLIQYWTGGGHSKYTEFGVSESEKGEANNLVSSLLKTATMVKVRTKEEVVKTMHWTSTNPDIVQLV